MKTKIIAIIGVISLVLFGILHIYCFYGTKQINLEFPEEIIKELEVEFSNTPNNQEFVGNLYLENNKVIDYEFIGYKVLPNFRSTGSSILVNVPEYSNITIHSHPGGIIPLACWISPIDKLSLEEISCIYCNNKIKCYEI